MSEITSKQYSILEIPLEVLEDIFSYLDVTSLHQLTMTCQYFKDFIEGRPKFWRCIDGREGSNSDIKTQFCINRINKITTHVCLRGNENGYGQIPANFLKSICPLTKLRVIALENQKFDGSKVCLKDFPACLEELSIKNSLVKRAKYFFKNSDKNMHKLRVLIVDGCRWMSLTYFKWISKYESLEIFSAANCLSSNFYVAYIWNKDKCKRLRIVDYRFSLAAFGDDLIDAWSGAKPLHLLYFQNVASAQQDYGVKINYNPNLYSDVEDEITDESFEKYAEWVFGHDFIDTLPKSYLYKDPYPACTCRYKEKGSNTSSTAPEVTQDYNFTAFHREAMETDWDQESSGHNESEYMQSDDEYIFESNEGKLKNNALRRLSLRGFKKITDRSLGNIQDVDLDLLDVTGTGVSKEGIEDFLDRHPNCRVVHPVYCVCKPTSPF